MPIIEIDKRFYDAYEYCSIPEQRLYLGMGNSHSPIIIIGKECSYPDKDEIAVKENLITREKALVDENLSFWHNILYPNSKPIDTDKGIVPGAINPYGEQFNKISRTIGKTASCSGHSNQGTSATWVNYQKLYDLIYNNGRKSDTITFHKNFFITELNQIPSAYSTLQIDSLRKESIQKRKELFRMDFFQRCPVIIVAAGHYPKKYGFDMEDLFGVEWKAPTRGIKNQFYNLHYKPDNSGLVIHTRQLSMNVSNKLLEEIAEHIKPWV